MGFSLVVEHLLSKYEALGSALSSALEREKKGRGGVGDGESERENIFKIWGLRNRSVYCRN